MTPIVTVPPPASLMETLRPRKVAVVAGQPEVDAHAFIAWIQHAPALDFYRIDARTKLVAYVALDASELNDADTLAVVCQAHLAPRREVLALIDQTRLYHPSTRVALVLLHASRDVPKGTSAWLDAIHPDEHHHAHMETPAHAQRLARLPRTPRRGPGAGLRRRARLRASRGVGGVEQVRRRHRRRGRMQHGRVRRGADRPGDLDPAQGIDRTRSIFLDNGGVYDWHLPWISLIAGDRLTGRVADLFGAHTDIEDLWLPWFCVTTSLTSADKVLHRRGRVLSAIRATSSIPGVAPPVAIDGQYHLDGGILDSLPVAHARTPSIGAVIAVNVTHLSAIVRAGGLRRGEPAAAARAARAAGSAQRRDGVRDAARRDRDPVVAPGAPRARARRADHRARSGRRRRDGPSALRQDRRGGTLQRRDGDCVGAACGRDRAAAAHGPAARGHARRAALHAYRIAEHDTPSRRRDRASELAASSARSTPGNAARDCPRGSRRCLARSERIGGPSGARGAPTVDPRAGSTRCARRPRCPGLRRWTSSG